MVYRKRKRLLLLAVTLLLGAFYCYTSILLSEDSAQQQEETSQKLYCYVNGKEGVSGTQILSQRINNKNYLFLPSGTDITALPIHFFCPNGEQVFFQDHLIHKKILVDLLNDGIYHEKESAYKLTFQVNYTDASSKNYRLWIMVSEHIPSVFLVSDNPTEEGRAWVEATPEHSNVAEATVYELDANGNILCRQKAETLRIRGNFTASARKKAYQFKLRSKEDMLDIREPRKSFALLANAYDATLQHNTVSYQLGKELGLKDTPDCQPVDVYYDGKYVGNYLLTELPGISNTSVAIEENGSFFMQIDYAHYLDGKPYLELSNGMFITVEEPEECTEEDLAYIRQIWEELVETVECGGINPSTNKTIEDYLDLDSYARYYLVQQFAKNPDGFSSSTYCYIPHGEDKIYFCGLWDFDLCYGIDHEPEELTKPSGYYPDNTGADLSAIPVVSQTIKDVYENELYQIVEDILLGDEEQQGRYLKSLAKYNEEIYASQRMNYKLWDLNQTGLTVVYESYEESIDYFKNFVQERNSWLSRAINNWNGCGLISKIELVAKHHLAGMPLEIEMDLNDKWCGGKIVFVDVLEQDSYFETEKEYHCRILLRNQWGCSFSENTSIVSSLGTVESQSLLENGMLEVVLNIGMPEVTNTVYQGVDYAPVYDKEFYLEHYPEVVALVGTSDEAVLEYFVTQGMQQAHQGCENYDVDFCSTN